jgi:hypothetical protein
LYLQANITSKVFKINIKVLCINTLHEIQNLLTVLKKNKFQGRLEWKFEWRLIGESCSCLLVSFITSSANLQKTVLMDCLKTTLSNIENGVDGGENN